MLDIRLIREQPDDVKTRLTARGSDLSAEIDAVLGCDVRRRQTETELQQLLAERKRLSKEIGTLRARGADSSAVEAEVRGFGERMDALNRATTGYDEKQRDLLLRIPNLPAADVPVGADATANPVLREWGAKPALERVEDHVAIGARLRLFDFDRATKISGSGFVCYTGAGARLERALINFLLDLHTCEHGYCEIIPPLLVRPEMLIGTSQLPKFADQLYHSAEDDVYLVPTAEVPVTNLENGELKAFADLPIRYAAYTPCFRREAGAAGLGTRGLIRLHQFDKIELVKITAPENSATELEALTADAERALQILELHYRVIELCTGDLGFGSQKTYDIEVWSPGQQDYLEVSSCSNFGDYQARRMNLRYKDVDGKNRFCHTLNGSGTALARLYVALIESGLQPDGTIRLPEPLHRYFGNDHIG